ncbi:MAG TPA: thermonuclease family protein [Bacteroidales bacterium]|nr:thermonuclease family protein [Bacteroidales bacterium]
MNKRNFPLVGLAVFFLLLPSTVRAEKKKQIGLMAVTKVVDGDTFWVDDGSEKGKKVRLIGVDTPETLHPQKAPEPYGREASEFTKSLLEGKKVRLEFDVDSLDRYGRLLAYVYLENGLFVNAELVRKGYAQVATFPPNVKYADYFLKLQRKARNRKLGLWRE